MLSDYFAIDKYKEFSSLISKLKKEYDDLWEENKLLREENKELKAEHYKHNELQKLSGELKMCRERLYESRRYYGLSKNQFDQLFNQWKKHVEEEHNETESKIKKSSCGFSVKISDFAEVTVYTFKCDKCGKEFDLYV